MSSIWGCSVSYIRICRPSYTRTRRFVAFVLYLFLIIHIIRFVLHLREAASNNHPRDVTEYVESGRRVFGILDANGKSSGLVERSRCDALLVPFAHAARTVLGNERDRQAHTEAASSMGTSSKLLRLLPVIFSNWRAHMEHFHFPPFSCPFFPPFWPSYSHLPAF